MTPAARLSAAIEVLAEILRYHRPAAQALADWGKAHRFAGSGDRAAIGNLVYDALRRRHSLAARMGSDSPRALVLAAAPNALGLAPDAVVAAADGTDYAIESLTAAETEGLARDVPSDAPDHVRGDIPEWLAPSFARAFGNNAVDEAAALARRAPVDLRANLLKADRDKVLRALAPLHPVATPFSPTRVRIAPPSGAGRTANVEAEPGHGKGWYEVQDEASQIVAFLAGAGPRIQVLHPWAGAGGETLARAAGLRNTGQIYAYDAHRS